MWLAALAAPLPGPTEAPLERPGAVAGGACERIRNLWATDHFCPTGGDKSNLRLSCAPGALFSRRSAPSGALAAPFGQVDDLLARVRGGVAGPLGGLPSQADARGEPGNKEEREGGDREWHEGVAFVGVRGEQRDAREQRGPCPEDHDRA